MFSGFLSKFTRKWIQDRRQVKYSKTHRAEMVLRLTSGKIEHFRWGWFHSLAEVTPHYIAFRVGGKLGLRPHLRPRRRVEVEVISIEEKQRLLRPYEYFWTSPRLSYFDVKTATGSFEVGILPADENWVLSELRSNP
jgi:hypothetical protein